jgi:succinate dehydrogenase/fumarate reductase iron-sulfur protein
MEDTIKKDSKLALTVFRYEPGSSPVLEDYEVPFSIGLTLLDALRFIQTSLDPTLAFRWECRKATCGVCTVALNGQPVLACQARLDTQVHATVTPMANFPVIKDLVVDLRPALHRLALVRPCLEPGEETIESKAEADLSRSLRSCIECWACVSVCPVIRGNPQTIADPVGMVRLARFALDKRDRLDRRELAVKLGLDRYNCAECRLCVDVCPKGIRVPDEAIAALRSET